MFKEIVVVIIIALLLTGCSRKYIKTENKLIDVSCSTGASLEGRYLTVVGYFGGEWVYKFRTKEEAGNAYKQAVHEIIGKFNRCQG